MDQSPKPSQLERVVPLLATLSEVENKATALAMRLDPITSHDPANDAQMATTNTVTGRLAKLGDVLQYLLDHIEL